MSRTRRHNARASADLKHGWTLVLDADGSVWLNDGPDVTVGAGICIGQDRADAVAALEEIEAVLQSPWGTHAEQHT